VAQRDDLRDDGGRACGVGCGVRVEAPARAWPRSAPLVLCGGDKRREKETHRHQRRRPTARARRRARAGAARAGASCKCGSTAACTRARGSRSACTAPRSRPAREGGSQKKKTPWVVEVRARARVVAAGEWRKGSTRPRGGGSCRLGCIVRRRLPRLRQLNSLVCTSGRSRHRMSNSLIITPFN
jgi:hypothetical protein